MHNAPPPHMKWYSPPVVTAYCDPPVVTYASTRDFPRCVSMVPSAGARSSAPGQTCPQEKYTVDSLQFSPGMKCITASAPPSNSFQAVPGNSSRTRSKILAVPGNSCRTRENFTGAERYPPLGTAKKSTGYGTNYRVRLEIFAGTARISGYGKNF
ncbi:hypothetical protein Bbelb_265800 [Branchiostoma belcheri]|nr:hypothetical protein Bbelb_265800 [Branchiostoma belcheri]